MQAVSHISSSKESHASFGKGSPARCVHFDGAGWARNYRGLQPWQILRGDLWRDSGILEEHLRQMRQKFGVQDEAFAAGTVDYKGSFEFAFFLNKRHTIGFECKTVPVTPVVFQAEMDEALFCALVRRAQEYIAAGDIYQVNLARRYRCAEKIEPRQFYAALQKSSPAPYSAYLQQTERTVLSKSPECFLRLEGKSITTCPIKGTRPRGVTAEDDSRMKYDLVGSPKEQAELLMITDLERSDLGQICEFGSIQVGELATLKSFAHVHHLVSQVRGRLRADISHLDALRFCFPGGSITGAPKKRAREIINELETSERGLYTGAVGYFGADGFSEFSIAIRTVVIEQSEAHFHVGAGIVADSIPEQEFLETEHKAAGILAAASE